MGTKELIFRMAEIEKEILKLTIEYNDICAEIEKRYPNLKGDPNLERKQINEKDGSGKCSGNTIHNLSLHK